MISVDWSDPQTLWLNITNAALGAVVLICVLVLAVGVVQELRLRARRRAEEPTPISAAGDHVFDVPGLGLTMADGGESVPPERK
jgi:hypothetical protein